MGLSKSSREGRPDARPAASPITGRADRTGIRVKAAAAPTYSCHGRRGRRNRRFLVVPRAAHALLSPQSAKGGGPYDRHHYRVPRRSSRIAFIPRLPDHSPEIPAPAGTGLSRHDLFPDRPPHSRATLHGRPFRPRPPGRHRLHVDPAGGSGHRTLGRGLICPQSDLFRSGKHRQTGPGRRLQRRGLDPWGPWQRGPQIRPQNPVYP